MFVMYHYTKPDGTGMGAVVHVFCGDYRNTFEDIPAKPACRGGGTVYTKNISVPKGSTITFVFNRQKATHATGASTVFYKGPQKLYYNWLDRALVPLRRLIHRSGFHPRRGGRALTLRGPMAWADELVASVAG
jgi:hypothetical protein